MAMTRCAEAEEAFDWWWDENYEVVVFLDTLSPSDGGRLWR